ncbi:MAG: hypothetical protein Q8R28_23220 [Dehalococcoidia bacterium]|nr:hypothetical protein [Dehalococcoidia bacterium]
MTPHWNDQVDLFLPGVLKAADRPLPGNAPDILGMGITLVLVVEGHVYSSHTGGDKEAMLFELAPKSSIVLAAWHGQYRTDVFLVPEALWKARLSRLESGRREQLERKQKK